MGKFVASQIQDKLFTSYYKYVRCIPKQPDGRYLITNSSNDVFKLCAVLIIELTESTVFIALFPGRRRNGLATSVSSNLI